MNNDLHVHILWEFTEKPWGGGNQFLKALRQQFIRQGVYTDVAGDADVILFNSHQFQKQALKLKLRYPNTLFVHRVDGPLFRTRGDEGIPTDRKIFFCNDLIADATIFQSAWSRQESYRLGLKKNRFETCIVNAPDPTIFHPASANDRPASSGGKIRLITTTWSSNPRKGFDIYHFLDEHLDFDRYSMTFVGNLDRPFRNITAVPPLPSNELADMLRSHDIFIAASRGEPCSNSFLEALHCGLPAVARNDASYPEVLNGNGVLFENAEDVIHAIDRLADSLGTYSANLAVIPLEEIAERYSRFFISIRHEVASNAYRPKKLSATRYALSRIRLKNL